MRRLPAPRWALAAAAVAVSLAGCHVPFVSKGGSASGSSSSVPAAEIVARRAVTALAIAGVAAAAVVMIWYRGTYHIWPGQAAGARVHWCGRDYENDQGPSSAETLQQAKAGSSLPLRVAADYPPLGPRQQLLAVSMAGQPAACPTVVFLKTGSDSYLPYNLLGGP